jgi:hypothetical protein
MSKYSGRAGSGSIQSQIRERTGQPPVITLQLCLIDNLCKYENNNSTGMKRAVAGGKTGTVKLSISGKGCRIRTRREPQTSVDIIELDLSFCSVVSIY